MPDRNYGAPTRLYHHWVMTRGIDGVVLLTVMALVICVGALA